MVFQGKISLKELDRNPVELEADETDPWIQSVLTNSAPKEALVGVSHEQWAERSTLSTKLRAEKVGKEYMVSGELAAKVLAPCSRCGDEFKPSRFAEFRVFLTQATHPKKGQAAPQDEYSDDPDFVFFDSDEINLVDVLSEQLIVLEPVAECPSKKADGSCELCGENPQYAGQGSRNGAASPFSKLADLVPLRVKGKL